MNNTTNTTERRPIKGYNTFEIDTNGKVWNTVTNRTLKEHINPAGFSYVIIGGKFHTIAYLMKAAFFADDNLVIRHKDGDRTNNKLSNLYTWCDGNEFINPDGSEKKAITLEVDPQTKEVIKIWPTISEAARQMGVDDHILRSAVTNNRLVNGRKFEMFSAALDGLGLFDYTDGKHIIQIYYCGELVKETKSVTAARDYTGDCPNVIDQLLKNGGESQRGYRYKWKLSTTPKAEPTPKTPRTPKPKKTERKVCQYSLTGELIATYANETEALPITGVSSVTFHKALEGNDILPKYNKVLGGYIWMYEGKKFTYRPQTTTKALSRPAIRKAVRQYTLNGELLNTYNSISEAAAANNTNVGQISNCCSGKVTNAGGCVWRFEGDAFDKYTTKAANKKKVLQMVKDENGATTIVNQWDSLADAANALNKSFQTLAYWIKEGGKRKDGYYYAYSNE